MTRRAEPRTRARKPRPYALLILLFLFLASFAHADTNVSGIISTDRTWSIAGSPYIVTGNVLVNNGVTLTIEPGVTVRLNSGKSIQIDGTLIARGTAGNLITCTKNQADNWGYLYFSDLITDAQYDGNDNYTGGSILEYCAVEYGGNASVTNNAMIRLEAAHPYLVNCTIRNASAHGVLGWSLSGNLRVVGCTFQSNSGVGIAVSGGTSMLSNCTSTDNGGSGVQVSAPNSVARLSNCTVSSNHGDGVWVTSDYVYNTAELHVSDCVVERNGASGVHFESAQGTCAINRCRINSNMGNAIETYGPGGLNVSIAECTLAANGSTAVRAASWNCQAYTLQMSASNVISNMGGGVHLDCVTATLSSSVVLGNRSFAGAGISTNGGLSLTNCIVADNLASGTGGALFISGNSTIRNNGILRNSATDASAIYLEGNDGGEVRQNTLAGNISSGAPIPSTIFLKSRVALGSNTILGNSARRQLSCDVDKGTTAISAESNYWGTTDDAAIQEAIWDWFDDSNKEIVDYTPFLTAPDPAAPVSPPTGVALAGLSLSGGTGNLNLTWSANPETDIAGYRIWYDTDAGYPYENHIDVGNVTSATLPGLALGQTYYVAVTGYDADVDSVGDWFDGNESWFSEEITAEIVNHAPVWQPRPDTTGAEGVRLAFTVAATDVDGQTLRYSATNLPAGATFDTTTGAFNWTPTYTQSGQYTITFTVSDGVASVQKNVKLTIGYVNRPPVWAARPDTSTNEGVPLSFTVSASDAEGQTLTYSMVAGPGGSSFNAATRTFGWTPTYSQEGVYDVIFSVSDGSATVSDTVRIMVMNAGGPTPVSGTITTTTWTKANSPYRVTGTITVPTVNTLTIEPGVDVLFDSDVQFIVNGRLRAIGSLADSIRFMKGTASEWGGIRITGGDSSTIGYGRISDGHADGPVGDPATAYGGGIYVSGDGTRLEIFHGVVSDNRAGDGGGICNHLSSTIALTHCTITLNSANRYGGGIYNYFEEVPLHFATMILSDCRIALNTASIGGGVANVSSARAVLANCTISGNAADKGAGVWNYYALGTLANCTMTGNLASSSGGGLFCGYYGKATLTNDIVWGNAPEDIYNDPRDPGTVGAIYSDVGGGWFGEGNINTDPLFSSHRDSAYHLTGASPCIDAGDPASPKDPDSTRADMGAFYFPHQVNGPPVWAARPDTSTSENQHLTFTVFATDPDGQTLSYRAPTIPSGATFDTSSHVFAWTPGYDFVAPPQTYRDTLAIFSVSDGEFTVRDTVGIRVNDVNRPPVWSARPDTSTNEAVPLSFTVSATDPDRQTLTYSATQLPQGAAFDAATRTFAWTPGYDQAGETVAVFAVTDGEATVVDTVAIHVSNTNFPPQIITTSLPAATERRPYVSEIVASDPGDRLSFTFTAKPVWLSFSQTTDTSGVLSGTPAQKDTTKGAAVSVEVRDPYDSLRVGNFVLVVNDTNYAPRFSEPPPASLAGDENAPLSAQFALVDPDADSLTVTVQPDSGVVSLLRRADSTVTFRWNWMPSFAAAGPHDLEFVIRDVPRGSLPTAEVRQTLHVSVRNVNRAPLVSVATGDTTSPTRTVSFAVSATDPDGQAVAYTAVTLPAGATFDPATGAFAWTRRQSQPADVVATFSAYDGDTTILRTLSVHASVPNQPPTIGWATAPPDTVSWDAACGLTVSDAEGDAARVITRYSMDGGGTWLPAAASGDTAASAAAPRTITWRTRQDLASKALWPSARFRFVPVDLDTGAALERAFCVLNLPCDWDRDGKIGLADFAALRAAWSAQDTTKNLGPYSVAPGESIPNIVPTQDRKIDFEDLMAFGMLWDWAAGKGRVKWVACIATKPAAAESEQAPILLRRSPEGGVDVVLAEGREADVIGLAITLPSELARGTRLERGSWVGPGGWWLSWSDTSAGVIETWVARDPSGRLVGRAIARIIVPRGVERVTIGVAYEIRREGDGPLLGAYSETVRLLLLPERWTLGPVAPNPFNPVTTIRYGVPEPGRVRIAVYDLLGQQIAVLTDAVHEPGFHTVSWNGTTATGRPVASGVYLVRLEGDGVRLVRRMTLLR